MRRSQQTINVGVTYKGPQPSNGLFPRHRWAFPIGNFIQHCGQSIGEGC